MPADPDERSEYQRRIRTMVSDPAWKEEQALRAREAEAVIYTHMFEAPESAARISAAAKLHAIIEGTPVARNVNADGGSAPAVAVRKFFHPPEDEAPGDPAE